MTTIIGIDPHPGHHATAALDSRGEVRDVREFPNDSGGPAPAHLAWNHTYETVRPHQALGYKTPDQFYRHWLNTNTTRKEPGYCRIFTYNNGLP